MTRDQFLCEKVMGECWHESADPVRHWKGCRKCGATITDHDLYFLPIGMKHPNFSRWTDKGRLLDFVMGQDDWEAFKNWAFRHKDAPPAGTANLDWFLDNFADLVAEYRGWKA